MLRQWLTQPGVSTAFAAELVIGRHSTNLLFLSAQDDCGVRAEVEKTAGRGRTATNHLPPLVDNNSGYLLRFNSTPLPLSSSMLSSFSEIFLIVRVCFVTLSADQLTVIAILLPATL